MLPLISIQILNWNRADESLRAIQSAANQSYPNIEIVFVDNGSTDNSIELVRHRFPNIKIVALDKNFGCPEGRNRGISHCKGDFIFYLDNDGMLNKDAVAKAYETIKDNVDIGIVTGIVYDFDNLNEVDTSIAPRSYRTYWYNDFQGGICLHRKSVYNKVGKYPAHFFYGGEESYFSCKLFDAGFRIVKNESVILWHKQSVFGRNKEAELLNRFYNKLYVCGNLYPVEHALLFTVAFPLKYAFHSFKHNVHKPFLRTFFSRYFSTVLKAWINRSPIKRSTFKLLSSPKTGFP